MLVSTIANNSTYRTSGSSIHKSFIIVSRSLVFLHIFSQLILLCVLIEGTAARISPRSSSTPYRKVQQCDSCTSSGCMFFARHYSCQLTTSISPCGATGALDTDGVTTPLSLTSQPNRRMSWASGFFRLTYILYLAIFREYFFL